MNRKMWVAALAVLEKAVFLREHEIELKEEIERVKAASSERPAPASPMPRTS